MSEYRFVVAAGQRMNVFGSTDTDDAIRLAVDHWQDELRFAQEALAAVAAGDVTVSEAELPEDDDDESA